MQSNEIHYGTCEVCYYANGIASAKEVKFCNTCKAWICKDCADKYLLRTKAAVTKFFINLF
jgi:hypothetical protein